MHKEPRYAFRQDTHTHKVKINLKTKEESHPFVESTLSVLPAQ